MTSLTKKTAARKKITFKYIAKTRVKVNIGEGGRE